MSFRLTATIVAGALVLTACQRPDDETTRTSIDPIGAPAETTSTTIADGATGSTTEATTTTPVEPTTPSTTAPTGATTTPPTSTAAPASTAPTTAPPATTRPAPTSPADLVLAFHGVEPFLFGMSRADVVAGLSALLGDPVSDDAREYPMPDDGVFLTDDGSLAFVFPFGRTVCFTNGLCTEFGAGSDSALLFTGWNFAGDDAAGLATEDGITVGSVWADHLDAIEVDEGGCFQEGYGNATGVDLVLVSAGEPFLATDDDGNQTPQVPDPADVTVVAMSAGELPTARGADC